MNLELVAGAIAGIGIPVLFATFGFLWGIHRDIGDLRERMARLERFFERFTGRSSSQSDSAD